MDFVKSYYGKNEPLTSWTLLSPVFFQICVDQFSSFVSKYFLQNPYFRKLVVENKVSIYFEQKSNILLSLPIYLYWVVVEVWNDDMVLWIDGHEMGSGKFVWFATPGSKLLYEFPIWLKDEDFVKKKFSQFSQIFSHKRNEHKEKLSNFAKNLILKWQNPQFYC